MHLFRTHFTRWAVSLILTIGMASHLAIPYSSQAQKTAFVQWLDRSVVENGDESETSIRDQIRQMPVLYENFPLLLKQASMLVVNHKNDFNLPLEQNREDASKISLWLIEKWSQHQNESGSMDALLPETVKPGMKWFAQHQAFTGYLTATSTLLSPLFSKFVNDVLYVVQNQPLPFLSGISINAP